MPKFVSIWEKASETFPEKNLRKYFEEYEHFSYFFDSMNLAYKNEEVRFYNMFEVCPDLKKVAKDTSKAMIAKIEAWSVEAGWI